MTTGLSEKTLKEMFNVLEMSELVEECIKYKIDKRKAMKLIKQCEDAIKKYEVILVRLTAPSDLEMDENIGKAYFLFGEDMYWEFDNKKSTVSTWVEFQKKMKAAEIRTLILEIQYEIEQQEYIVKNRDSLIRDIREKLVKNYIN